MSRATFVTKCALFLSLFWSFICIGASPVVALKVGEPAPDFTLPSTTGKSVSLSQFKGQKHVLIQFYSMDFNPT